MCREPMCGLPIKVSRQIKLNMAKYRKEQLEEEEHMVYDMMMEERLLSSHSEIFFAIRYLRELGVSQSSIPRNITLSVNSMDPGQIFESTVLNIISSIRTGLHPTEEDSEGELYSENSEPEEDEDLVEQLNYFSLLSDGV